MQHKSRALLSSLLDRLANALGADTANWFRAMRTEAKSIDSSTDRLLWNIGIGVAILRCTIRKIATENSRRPFEVHATATYLVGFSVYVVAHLVIQILNSGIRESWYEAWFPVLVCFWIAVIPAIIAAGVWLYDDFARKLAIAFATLELGMVSWFVHSYGVNDVRLVKFFCSIAVLAAMLSPRVRTACRWRPESRSSYPFGLCD